MLAPADGTDPASELASRDGDGQERHGGSGGERGRQDHRRQPDAVRRPEHRDGSQDRPGAREVQDTETQAEHERSVPAAWPACAHSGEWALKQCAQRRDEIAEPYRG